MDLNSIGVTDASSLGILSPAFNVVERMAKNVYPRIKSTQKKQCKTIIQRAALVIKEAHANLQDGQTSITDITRFQKHLEEIHALLENIASMSYMKAILRSDEISKAINRANILLHECLQMFSDKARRPDQDIPHRYSDGQKGNSISSMESVDIPVEAHMTSFGRTRTTSVSTGKNSPSQRAWLITEYDLEFCGTIGHGMFSTVHKARFRGTTVAVKVLKHGDTGRLQALEREIKIWSNLRHDNIVPFYGACTLTSPPYVVSRYMKNGNLVQYLASAPDANRTELILDVSLGMYYLHEENIVHGDLKGVNVLVDDAGNACITDFGLSKVYTFKTAETRTNNVSGTLRFLAPEALMGASLSFETDVYAFGMVIYEAFTEETPFIREPDNLVMNGRVRLERPVSNKVHERGFNDELWVLLSDCISRNPPARPRFKTIQASLYSFSQRGHAGTGGGYPTTASSEVQNFNLTDWGLYTKEQMAPSETRNLTNWGLDTREQMAPSETQNLTDWGIGENKQTATLSDLEEAKQMISSLLSDLEAARHETKTLKALYDFESNRFKLEKSRLQHALDSLKREINKAEHRFSPGVRSFKEWMIKTSKDTDMCTSGSLIDIHNVFAYRAFVNVRSENWNSAWENAKKSIEARPSAIGYIAEALALIGKGEVEEATQVFDLAFKNGNPDETDVLLLFKAVILFVAGKQENAISRVHDLIAISKNDKSLYYCCIQVLGKMYMMQRDYTLAVRSLELAQDFVMQPVDSHLETISFIFGWTFDELKNTIQRYHCEDLVASGRLEEATKALLKMLDSFTEEMRASETTSQWITNLKTKCVDMLEALGDRAVGSGEHDDAIAHYSSALSLDPSNPIDILLKRSKAKASKGLWEDALTDANEVIELAPSSHLGYESKFAALHGAEDYHEAYNALHDMFSNVEHSTKEEINRMRENYTTPDEAIAAIDNVIHEIRNLCPLVLIDVTTGRLHDVDERIRMFKMDTSFKKLISDTVVKKLDRAHIRQAVAKYFKWTMFSHTWEGNEPTFHDVNLVNSIWDLEKSPLKEKICRFCTMVRDNDCRWAWSDTCCIDKSTSAILNRSLTSMYSWYEEAAETFVYLTDVLSPSELGALRKSRWMTRAWTLQELLASKVIRFYTRDWKLYLNDIHTNHKESPAIKQELAHAMGVTPETITSFRPEDLGVREKLRLASERNATVEEDLAYSLIGIFSSDIIPRYGLGKTALGHLLENIVARTGDITVIAWTGKSLPYNSALPNSLAVYARIPYISPRMEASELDKCVEELRGGLPAEDALTFYNKVTRLPRATFLNRCLQLPCITFTVTKLGIQDAGGNQGFTYNAVVSLLGRVEFRTAEVLVLTKPRKLVFVHPWIRELRDQHDEFGSDDESEVASSAGSQVSEEPGNADDSDASAPSSPLHATPLAQVDRYTQALRLISRLGCSFNALLLLRQSNNQYKRIATEHEIVISGMSYQTSPKDIRTKVLEIV